MCCKRNDDPTQHLDVVGFLEDDLEMHDGQ